MPDKSVIIIYTTVVFFSFPEHLLECILVWTQSTSSLNIDCVIVLNQKTTQEWSLTLRSDRNVMVEINGSLKNKRTTSGH